MFYRRRQKQKTLVIRNHRTSSGSETGFPIQINDDIEQYAETDFSDQVQHCSEMSTKPSSETTDKDEYQPIASESNAEDVVYAAVNKQKKQKRDMSSTVYKDTGVKDEEVKVKVNQVVYSEVNKKKYCHRYEHETKEDDDKHTANFKVDESHVYAEVKTKKIEK